MPPRIQAVGRAPATSPQIPAQARPAHVVRVPRAQAFWPSTKEASETHGVCPVCPVTQAQALNRRDSLAFVASTVLSASVALLTPGPATASIMACPGMNGYALSKCLKEARKAAAASEDAEGGGAEDDVQSARLKYRQFEQPGELVTLPSGKAICADQAAAVGGCGPEGQDRSKPTDAAVG